MQIGVIFDMDGVLVDSGPPHMESWRMLAEKHGIEITEEQFRSSFGKTSRDIIRNFWGDGVPEDEIRRYDDEKEQLYRDIVTGQVPLMTGLRELLADLTADGCAMAVATSGPIENVELVLREGEIEPHFGAVVTGYDVKHGKPAPDVFLLAAERLQLDPAVCVVVEDAPVGIQAALAAGMKAIGLTGTHPAERLREAGATVVVDSLSEIGVGRVRELLST